MNEFMDVLATAFKELRSDRGGRKFYVRSSECQEAEKDMEEKENGFALCSKQLSEEQHQCLTSYLDAMARYHFEEEQRAYTQGMVDAVLMLDGLGLVKCDSSIDEIIKKIGQ